MKMAVKFMLCVIVLCIVAGCAGWETYEDPSVITLKNMEVFDCSQGVSISCYGIRDPSCKLFCYFRHGQAIFALSDVTSFQRKIKR